MGGKESALFLQLFVIGLALGGIYALISLGYSMVYGILELMNFAHGDVYMFGVLLAGAMATRYHVNIFLAAIAGVICGGGLAMLVEIFAYRPLRSESRTISMITALGAAMVIRNGEEAFFGVEVHYYPPLFSTSKVSFLNVSIPIVPLLTLALTIIIIVVFSFVITRTKLGKAIRCLAQDIPTAALMGININQAISLVYIIGGMMGVMAGILYSASFNSVFIGQGFAGTIRAFTAAIIGGIGNLNGCLIGGLILGLSESFGLVYISSAYRDAISFFLMIAILVIKPSGLLGRRVAEKL